MNCYADSERDEANTPLYCALRIAQHEPKTTKNRKKAPLTSRFARNAKPTDPGLRGRAVPAR